MKIIKKTINIISSFFLILISFTSVDFLLESNIRGIPSCYGLTAITVLSNSMQASNINKGNLYLIKQEKNYCVGDIISFKFGNNIWFHEIISYDSTKETFQTKGSSNLSKDPFVITKNDIIGKKVDIDINWITNNETKLLLVFSVYMIIMLIIGWFISECFEPETNFKSKSNTIYYKKNVKKVAIITLISLLTIIFCATNINIMSYVQSSPIQNINYVNEIAYTKPTISTDEALNIIIKNYQDKKSELRKYFDKQFIKILDSTGPNYGQSIANTELVMIKNCTWKIIKLGNYLYVYYCAYNIDNFKVNAVLTPVYESCYSLNNNGNIKKLIYQDNIEATVSLKIILKNNQYISYKVMNI